MSLVRMVTRLALVAHKIEIRDDVLVPCSELLEVPIVHWLPPVILATDETTTKGVYSILKKLTHLI